MISWFVSSNAKKEVSNKRKNAFSHAISNWLAPYPNCTVNTTRIGSEGPRNIERQRLTHLFDITLLWFYLIKAIGLQSYLCSPDQKIKITLQKKNKSSSKISIPEKLTRHRNSIKNYHPFKTNKLPGSHISHHSNNSQINCYNLSWKKIIKLLVKCWFSILLIWINLGILVDGLSFILPSVPMIQSLLSYFSRWD